jgi:hypothetical protein
MRAATGVVLVLLLVAASGCSRSTWDNYVATGDPGWDLHREIKRSREGFDRVEKGMTEEQVIELVGNPTSRSGEAMHWQFGEYRDAWVFLGPDGRVASTYWQDEGSLQLEEPPPEVE